MNPFPGATELIYYKKKKDKKKNKKFKRGDLECTCGALEEYFCGLSYIHTDKCIINTKRKA